MIDNVRYQERKSAELRRQAQAALARSQNAQQPDYERRLDVMMASAYAKLADSYEYVEKQGSSQG